MVPTQGATEGFRASEEGPGAPAIPVQVDKEANLQKLVAHPFNVIVPFTKDITRFMEQVTNEGRILTDPMPQSFSDNRLIRGYVVALRGEQMLRDLQTFAGDFNQDHPGVNIRMYVMSPDQRKFISTMSRGRQQTQVSASRTLSEVLSSDRRYYGNAQPREASERPAQSFR